MHTPHGAKRPSAPPLGELLSVSEAEGVRLGERTTSNIVPSNGRHSLSQPVRAASSLREGAKGTSCLRAAKSRPYRCRGAKAAETIGCVQSS